MLYTELGSGPGSGSAMLSVVDGWWVQHEVGDEVGDDLGDGVSDVVHVSGLHSWSAVGSVRIEGHISDAWTMRSIVGSGSVSRVIEGD